MNQSSRFPQISKAARQAGAGTTSRPVVPLFAMLVTSAILAGCQTHSVTVGAIPDDYRTTHPIVLSERAQVVDIPVTRGERRLTVAQKDVVKATLARYRANGSGIINILVPKGSDNAVAARHLRNDIMRVLRKSGLPSYKIASEPYPVPSRTAAAPIRLTYSAMTASTNACGKWPKDLLEDTENRHWENFGCASQNNLAAQIANPADLLGPRARGTIDANRNDTVIGNYENPTDASDTATWSPTITY
jgi:pilus assembly protein CpaD